MALDVTTNLFTQWHTAQQKYEAHSIPDEANSVINDNISPTKFRHKLGCFKSGD